MNCSVLDVNENELDSSCGYTEPSTVVETTSFSGHTESATNVEPSSSCGYTESATHLEPNSSSSYTELEPEPSCSYTFTELEPARNPEPSVIDGLPSLEEFCANTSDQCVRSIYNMIGERGDTENIFQLLASFPLQSETSVDSGNQQPDNRLAADDGRPGASSSTSVRQQSIRSEQAEWNAIISPPEQSFSTANTRGGISVIGPNQLMATPNSNQEGHATNETSSNHTDSLLTQLDNNSHAIEPDESQIEEAFQSVYNRFGVTSDKDISAKLTADTLESCLDSVRSSPLLICNSCLELFQYIPPFQVHIQTCCAAPRIELKQKMDQAAMNQLARALWKEAFIKDLKSHTPERVYDEPSLHTELDVLWEMDSSSTNMAKCREAFIRASVAIVSRRWVSNALANDLIRIRKSQQNKQGKKRTKSESDLEEVGGDSKPLPSSSKTVKPESKKKKRVRPPKTKEKVSKVTETDLAVRGLVHDLDESGRTPLRYHFTPETPVSDHGLDFTGFTPTSRTSVNRDESIKTPYSDSGVEFTPEMDCEIDRFVRNEQLAIDVDKLASEAAKDFESIVNGADPWDNGTSEDALSENEFVVGQILERRLRFKVENKIPQENDYEYLVAWEGYGDEDNTWEPYENLMHCTLKLKEFHDRLKLRAMKCRKGKRI